MSIFILVILHIYITIWIFRKCHFANRNLIFVLCHSIFPTSPERYRKVLFLFTWCTVKDFLGFSLFFCGFFVCFFFSDNGNICKADLLAEVADRELRHFFNYFLTKAV